MTNGKLANGAVSGSKIDLGSTPFSRIVFQTSGTGTIGLTGTPTIYPLASQGYTQRAGELNTYAAAVDVNFAASCVQPRSASAYLLPGASRSVRT